jgi:hypothetical protein
VEGFGVLHPANVVDGRAHVVTVGRCAEWR